ncbi:hypothetical protein T4B_2289 [Trichinella pseudospiralis]|uniref:Uncharacterized protein n=1 Tax=Trichinella pseudospiralis TaxID=6337 RepID=A0A0V1IHM5_TRIPS|nr:hypothetical protein T4B_2289 [Trichinella pseudospiralis]
MVVLVLLFSKQHCREEKLPLKVIIVSFAWFVPDAAAKVDQTRRISNWPLSIKIIESAKQMQTQVKMNVQTTIIRAFTYFNNKNRKDSASKLFNQLMQIFRTKTDQKTKK